MYVAARRLRFLFTILSLVRPTNTIQAFMTLASISQVTTLLNREKQLLEERKLLNREFERLKIQKSRPGYSRIREPPERLSDLLATTITGSTLHEPAVRLDLMSPRNEERFTRDLNATSSRTLLNGISRDRVILWCHGNIEVLIFEHCYKR